MKWNQIVFVKSANSPKDFPSLKDDRGQLLPEIVLLGRSNVGKSSLLNDLFSTKLGRTSSTPGKTQLIQFFKVDNQLAVADLPGYGYAKVPLEVRKSWGPMISRYLSSRPTIKLLLFLFDIRRLPMEEDIQMVEWLKTSQKPFMLVLTKLDKLTASQAAQQLKKIQQALQVVDVPYVLYSTTKNQGRNPLKQSILEKIYIS